MTPLSFPEPIEESPDWRDDAACRDVSPETFYPGPGRGADRIAKAVCDGCPVQADCLSWAIETDQRFGVWGGLGEKELRAVVRAKKRGGLSA